jgi:hypothetical protein
MIRSYHCAAGTDWSIAPGHHARSFAPTGSALQPRRADGDALAGHSRGHDQRARRGGEQASSPAHPVTPSNCGSSRRPRTAARSSRGRNHTAAVRTCDGAGSDSESAAYPACESDSRSGSSNSSSCHTSIHRSGFVADESGSSRSASSASDGPAFINLPLLQRDRSQRQHHGGQSDADETFVTALETVGSSGGGASQAGPRSRDRIDSDNVLFGSRRQQ